MPGLASTARARCDGGSGNPYSGRPASAGSSRPTTLIDELDTIRRSTSLAVCRAPIRMMPSERPGLRDVEEHLLDRAAALPRGVLVQLVQHREQQPAGPAALLARGLLRQHHADDEPLRALGQVVQIDPVSCWPSVVTTGGRTTPGRRGRSTAPA